MSSTQTIGSLIIILLIIGGGWLALSNNSTTDTVITEETGDVMMENTDENMTEDVDVMMEEGEAMMKKGSYEVYAPQKLAKAETGDVVLFFRASWCPTCRALDADIKKNTGSIPENVTILDVDYDKEVALKQKYGVTYQHTLVQVDSLGNQLAKWSNSPTLASLLAQVK